MKVLANFEDNNKIPSNSALDGLWEEALKRAPSLRYSALQVPVKAISH